VELNEADARFAPSFTPKEPGKGTGPGLATVYGIVAQSAGHIEVDSTPGCGTTFKIYLPRCEGVEPTKAATTPTKGSEAVLLVEDEAGVRGGAREILRSTGDIVLARATVMRPWGSLSSIKVLSTCCRLVW
jgi:two-component system, cell cycle sensor histidine kinase and response regulator CckA